MPTLSKTPDYDSGWVDLVAGGSKTITHNLGTTNALVYVEDDLSDDGLGISPRGYVSRLLYDFTSTQITIQEMEGATVKTRLKMWKLG